VTGRLLLVRHGVTTWNQEGRFQGHLDPPLSAQGRKEVRLLADRMAHDPKFRPSRIISSPLARALETAESIQATMAAEDEAPELFVDQDLVELGQGEWEGKSHAELEVDDAKRYAAWRSSSSLEPPPGGEPVEDGARRVAAAIERALGAGDATDSGAWPRCIVTHGGTLRLLAELLLDLERPRAWALETDNASLSILDPESGGWRLVSWNDTGHLLGRVSLHAGEEDGEALAL
jgi:broad specificity phosphatase PhoE